MKKNYPVTGVERNYRDNANILSTTDLKGAITYVNRDFLEISGFEEAELLGKNHNIVRHPDMPPEAFANLWDTVKSGQPWMGIVKNRCKNGDHYWVNAFVMPILEDGKVVQYQSVRTTPTREQVGNAERLYRQLLKGSPFESRLFPASLPGRLILAQATALLAGLGLTALTTPAVTAVAPAFTFAFSVCAAASYFLLQPLTRLAEQSRTITDDPVARKVYTGRDDEIGQLGLALQMAQAEAGAIVGRMADSACHLSNCSHGLTSAVNDSIQGIQRQQTETDQVATAIAEMSASVQEVAQNAQQTADAAQRADHEAALGKSIVQKTSTAIQSLASEIERSAAVIHELENHSEEISSVLEVIRGVAEQTNLLALNAAIEAARAGDQGRGFAVVADEVRVLAQRTQRSTTEIQGMIERLQSGAGNAVQAMAGSREHAERTVKHAQETAAALEAINRAVSTISTMSTQIATAVEEQSAVTEEINRSITAIRSVSDKTSSTVAGTDAVAGEVSFRAHHLQQLVSQFWAKRH